MPRYQVRHLIRLGIMLACLAALPPPAKAQEVAGANRYSGYEMSNNAYERYEVRPFANRAYLKEHPVRSILRVGPDATTRNRGRLVDSHSNVRFYTPQRNCVDCHAAQAKSRHVVRAAITCRQCHGSEPIPDNDHYYSPFNSIRRHAYVCAKCHQGASMSFATYRIHEPSPYTAATMAEFPLLAWGFWLMIAIAVFTFALFLPHTALWLIRETLSLAGRKGGEP